MDRKLESPSSRLERVECIRGAKSIAGEKSGMRRLRADEVVPSVVRRSEDDVRPGECLKSALKHGGREVRAIAIERNDARVACRCEMCKDRRKARREAITRLRHDGYPVTNYARQILDIGYWAHDGDVRAVE